MNTSAMVRETFYSQSVASTVEYHALIPALDRGSDALPLILHLHGALSSSAFLDVAKPSYDIAWETGMLPHAIVGCVSTPTIGGFYIDYPDGPQWERLVAEEFPRHLASRFALRGSRVVIGFSMGGYGALKLALRAPTHYRAVAALCPAVFPAEALGEVPEKNRPAILSDLNNAMGRDPDRYSINCVPAILRRNVDAIKASGLNIFLDCGAHDEFYLHDGAVYLHQVLDELDVDHRWESIQDCGHTDLGAKRLERALKVLGTALAKDES